MGFYYLFRAGLLDRPKRGYYKISKAGVQENKIGNKINIGYLKKFPSFVDFSNIENKKNSDTENIIETDKCQTPDEMISKALYSDNLQSELLEKLKQVDPIKFEQIVLQLMEKMNYGIGSMTKMSHDGGILTKTN